MGLAGGLLSGLAGGVMSLFSGPDPEYEKQKLSKEGGDALAAVNKRADKSVEERTSEQMQGAPEAAKAFTQMEPPKPGDAQGGAGDAIQKRLDRKTDIAVNRLGRKTKINAVDQKAVDYRNSAQLHQSLYQLYRGQADSMLNIAAKKEAASSSAINSIMGNAAKIGVQQFMGVQGGAKPIVTAGGGSDTSGMA